MRNYLCIFRANLQHFIFLSDIKQVHREAEAAEEQAARRSECTTENINNSPIIDFHLNSASRAMKGLYLLIGGVAIAFLSVGTLQVPCQKVSITDSLTRW